MQIYTWDKSGYESAYWKQYYKQLGCGASRAKNCNCAERDISYSREFFENEGVFALRAKNIVEKLNLQQSTDIFVVGCGLGLLMEELKKLGMNCWGCDNSHYIQTIKNKEKAQFPINNIDATASDFTSKVSKAVGSLWFDVVITEDMLSSHTDFTQILNNCEGILNPDMPKSNIVHIIDINVKEPFTVKTMEQWKELNPNHTWVDVNGA
jgi:2-polyprenyl-3-methyl-5-hydroxy-6-metoxy-1,4-benzoquinol methylase